ncbi:MAG: DUF2934 domain-containing protein [Nitrospirota bacterium]|nr:DUF2934 domain-containing protein [Nitrospirota bacterium]
MTADNDRIRARRVHHERSVSRRAIGSEPPAVAVRTKAADAAGVAHNSSGSVCDDLQVLIAQRADELYAGRGCQDGHALDHWLEAEREVLSQVPPV